MRRVLITTSGLGSRLGDYTKYTNKSLVKIGHKPVISHIIESYPETTEFVITTGFYGEQVEEFLKITYPNKKFIFVPVDKYEGKGSSLGYSILKAKKFLQCQFIFHASDTMVSDKISHGKFNWIGGYRGEGSSLYRSFNVLNGKIQTIQEKGAMKPDYLAIGLVGIKDYINFWETLEDLYRNQPENNSLGDTHVINKMIEKGGIFKLKEFKEWHDTGNTESLQKVRKKYADSHRVLEKLDESIFIFDDFVVKFFHNEEIVKNRVARGKILSGLVPQIESAGRNFYRYKYIEGKLFSKVANPINFKHLLQWSKKNLWKEAKEVPDQEFKKICHSFYYDKTKNRIEKFLVTRGVTDQKTVINEEEVPLLSELIDRIDFDWLANSRQTHFHGDFIPDNILLTEEGFSLLDWRQDFGGLLKAGDMYYDLAKLNHNLTVNHGIVNDNLFTINIDGNVIECDIMRKDNLVKCQEELFAFIRKEKLDERKVRILTALVWLNMSPLHHHPFDLFLFYFGKYNLWREIKNLKEA